MPRCHYSRAERECTKHSMSAIVMREDQRTVFVVDDDGVVSRRVLTIGFVNDNMVEVLDGLSDGDRIVTGGQNKLRKAVSRSN